MASPAIVLSADGVTYGAPSVKLQVAPGAPVYAKLDDTSDVNSCTWRIASQDDTTTALALIPGGLNGTTCVISAAGDAGTAAILQATINGGIDIATDAPNPNATNSKIKFFVPTGAGAEVLCFDEQGESGPFWWLAIINALIRSSGSVTGDVDPDPNTLVERDSNGQARATSFAVDSSDVAQSGSLRLLDGDQTIIAKWNGGSSSDNKILWLSGTTLSLGDNDDTIQTVSLGGADLFNVGNGAFTSSLKIGSQWAIEVGLSAGALQFVGAANDPLLLQARQFGGVGTAAGKSFTLDGQQGQNQNGSNDNNPGGDVVLRGGGPGAGGSGAPGTLGNVLVDSMLEIGARAGDFTPPDPAAWALSVDLSGNLNLHYDGVTQFVFSESAIGLSSASGSNPNIYVQPIPGFGATSGFSMFVSAQAGQAQTGAAANTNGGNLVLSGGLAGTGGSGAAGLPGDVELGSALLLDPITPPALPTSGWKTYTDGGRGQLTFADQNGVELLLYPGGISFASRVTAPSLSQDTVPGNGSAAGVTLTVSGQSGQQQTGSANNNNGGAAVLAGGSPGTGGTGAAGLTGAAQLAGGGGLEQLGGYSTKTVGVSLQLIGPALFPATGVYSTLRADVCGVAKGQRFNAVFQQRIQLQVGNANGTPDASGGVISGESFVTAASTRAPWSSSFGQFGGGVQNTVTNVVNDGSGHCKVTVTGASGIQQGSYVQVSGVGGTTGANGTWVIDSVVGSTFVLRGSTFNSAFTSAGSCTLLGVVAVVNNTFPVQLFVEGLAAPNWLAGETVVSGDFRVNGSNIYQCVTGGVVAGSGGPTGTGTAIGDGGAVWDYYGPSASGITVFWNMPKVEQLPFLAA